LGAHDLASKTKKSRSILSFSPSHDTLDPNTPMNRHDWRTLAFAASVTSRAGLHSVFGVN
jgi:hypothetical protein